jgi:two-component system, NarL family, sensor histidine kinase UhpB
MVIQLRAAPLMRSVNAARAYAFAILAAVLVPALILAGALAIRSARFERAQMEQTAANLAREATAAIERETGALENVLFTLANSNLLAIENLEGFYNQAKDAAGRLGVVIVLSDAQNARQIVNTALPWGASFIEGGTSPLSAADIASLQSGNPIVTNVFLGVLSGRYRVAVVVPVLRDGRLRFLMSAGIPLQTFADILGSLDIRPNQVVGVFDREGTFVARSSKQDEYAGGRAQVVPQEAQSVSTGINREGEAFHGFSRYSASLGWIISTGVPDRVLEAPMRQALTSVSAAGGVLFFVALGLAYTWGGRISRSSGALGIDRNPTREEFEILFDSAPNGVMVVDNQGRVVLLNAQIKDEFGYSAEELVGKQVEVLIPERFRGEHVGLRQTFTLDPQARPMGEGRDLFGLRKDGTEFPVEIGLNPINSGAEKLVMITVIDISRRRLEQQRLDTTTAERDDLRRRFIQAQEQERLRLAHELHDQTGQSLTGVMLELKGYEDSVSEPERTRLRLLRMQLDRVGQALHHVVWELRPPSIDELGLQSALGDYIEEWSAQYGVDADFHCSGVESDEISEEISTTVYRVVQEALTNVVKHAGQATSVSVVIDRTGQNLRLTVEDNGCGFGNDGSSEPKGRRDGGLGLPGMRERLTLIGGEFEVESSVGVGTTIFARIPLEPKKAAE